MFDRNKMRKRLKELRLVEGEELPASIGYLLGLIESTADEETRFELYGLLSNEYARLGMRAEATMAMENCAREFSQDPVSWIALAEHLIFIDNNYAAAKEVVQTAISKAKESGHFLRHAYNNLARVARNLEDYKLLEETLVTLTRIKTMPGRGDVAFEKDFLEGLPKGVVEPSILRKYLKNCK